VDVRMSMREICRHVAAKRDERYQTMKGMVMTRITPELVCERRA
jgi:hypothetical protein